MIQEHLLLSNITGETIIFVSTQRLAIFYLILIWSYDDFNSLISWTISGLSLLEFNQTWTSSSSEFFGRFVGFQVLHTSADFQRVEDSEEKFPHKRYLRSFVFLTIKITHSSCLCTYLHGELIYIFCDGIWWRMKPSIGNSCGSFSFFAVFCCRFVLTISICRMCCIITFLWNEKIIVHHQNRSLLNDIWR